MHTGGVPSHAGHVMLKTEFLGLAKELSTSVESG
jgi:hypothetical protein